MIFPFWIYSRIKINKVYWWLLNLAILLNERLTPWEIMNGSTSVGGGLTVGLMPISGSGMFQPHPGPEWASTGLSVTDTSISQRPELGGGGRNLYSIYSIVSTDGWQVPDNPRVRSGPGAGHCLLPVVVAVWHLPGLLPGGLALMLRPRGPALIMARGELIQYKVHFFYSPYLFIHLLREFVIVNGIIFGWLYNHIPTGFLLAGKKYLIFGGSKLKV